MTWFKRIALFLLTNILVLVTISVIMTVLGVKPYISAYGLNLGALLVFCLIWGMAGAFISLLLSKQMAKWFMGVEIIDERSPGPYGDLVNRVRGLSQAAGISMPEVGVYDSEEVNAFATGPTRNRSLIAVSTGLLRRMNRNEADGVLGHEISHIASGDMVTMTLIQGVVNAFAMFLSRIVAFFVGKMVDEKMENLVRFIAVIVFDILFSMLGSILVAYFSRWREFKADAGGARYAGRGNMIAALEKLKRTHEIGIDQSAPAFSSLKISGAESWLSLFATHPPLDARIDALRRSNS